MKKKLFWLTLAVGAASAVGKLIVNRKMDEIMDRDEHEIERNDISAEFNLARRKRESGDITEEEYRETLADIRGKAMARGENTVNGLLELAYGEARSAVYWHTRLMQDVKASYSYSLEDYIKRCPDEADERHRDELGLNPYAYRDQARTSAKELAEDYYENLRKTEHRLLEYVEMLGGKTSRIKKAFDKTRESCEPENIEG